MTKSPMRISFLSSGLLVVAMAMVGCSTASPSTTNQMNQFTSSSQDHVTLAVDDLDRVLVVWDSRRQQGGRYGIYGRWADLSGQPVGDEFVINQYTTGHQKYPSVAADADGGFWVAWTSSGQDGFAGGIVARRLVDSTWQPELAVNEHRCGNQEQPAIAVNEIGDALIVWVTETQDGDRLAARGFKANGEAAGPEVQLDSTGKVAVPRVAVLPDGRFAVAWQSTDNGPDGLFLQIVDGSGEACRPTQRLASPGAIECAMDAVPDGIILTWLEPKGDRYGIFMQKLDSEALPEGSTVELQAATDTEAWISGVHVLGHQDGGWTMAWNEDHSDRGQDQIRVQTFDAVGQPASEPRLMVEALSPGHKLAIAATTSAMAVSRSGSRVLGFSGRGTGSDSSAANLHVMDPVASGPIEVPALETQAVMVAATPNPPVFDPDFTPLDPTPRPRGAAVHDFEGITQTGWTPPDPDIAVGPSHVVEVVNGGIAFFEFDGTKLFQEPIEGGSGFWGSVGAPGFVFDPEVIWDPHENRFVAMANARNGNDSYFLLAVSTTDDPTDPWHKYLIDVSNFDDSIDSPNLAVDDSFIYVSADFFGPDKYLILCIKKSDALVGDPLSWKQVSLSGSGNQSLGLPVTWDAATPQYLLQSSEGTGNGITFSEIRLHAITSPDGDPGLTSYDLPVATYSYPAHPPQQGTTDRPYLFEPRFWSCIQRGGSVWAVHHVNNDRARVRWYEIAMNGWPGSGSNPTVAQWGEVDAGQGISTYFPGITVDGLGNAAVTFARSSANEYISMYSARRAAGDPLGTFQPMQLVRASSAPDTSGRWGDYAGASPYPDEPGRLWLAHEWTNGGGWRTWITEIDFELCLGDTNGDGQVNVDDILNVIAAFGACGACPEDMNGDGQVGVFEILVILDTWGPC